MSKSFIMFGLWAALVAQVDGAESRYETALQIGDGKLKQHQAAEARTAFREALGLAATADERADAQFRIARSYAREDNKAQARIEYAKVVQIAEASSELRVRAQHEIAQSFFRPWSAISSAPKTQDVEQARQEFTKILSINGLLPADKAQALRDIAGCYIAEKKLEPARDTLARIVALPDLGAADVHRLHAQMSLGDIAANPALARAEYSKALEFGIGQWALGAIARTYRDEKNYAQERATHTRVLETNSSPERKAEALIAIAQSFEVELKFAEARAEYARMLELGGVDGYSQVYSHFLTAKNYLAEKRPDLAKLAFRKAVDTANAQDAAPALKAEAEKQLNLLP